MKKNKIIKYLLFSFVVLLFSFFVAEAYAIDKDLSNLDDTTSVTIDVDGVNYTIENIYDINGLNNLKDAIIVALPTGMYKISLVSGWSWRYDNEVEFDIIENAIKKETLKGEFVKVNVYTDQYTEVNTLYNLINKKWLSKTDMTVWSNT